MNASSMFLIRMLTVFLDLHTTDKYKILNRFGQERNEEKTTASQQKKKKIFNSTVERKCLIKIRLVIVVSN